MNTSPRRSSTHTLKASARKVLSIGFGAPTQPIGCYGPQASAYTKRILTKRVVRLQMPRVETSEDPYGRTLAYLYLDTDGDGACEHLF